MTKKEEQKLVERMIRDTKRELSRLGTPAHKRWLENELSILRHQRDKILDENPKADLADYIKFRKNYGLKI